ncbi:LuxR C-terminal-related transcriptional regulator [Agromyces bauzanensis]
MGTWPIVGRDRVLVQVSRRLLEPNGQVAARGTLLVGDAGVGKTRLARELYRLVRRRQQHAVWTTASRTAQHQPLGAFARFATAGSDSLSLLRELAEQISPPGRLTAVFVDDVHALDPLSVMLVQTLAVRPWATVLLTARANEPLPDVILGLWKEDLLDRMEISPLDEEETGQLASSIVGRPVGALATRRLWQRSRGNPLYITHIARAWRAAAHADDERSRGRGDRSALVYEPDPRAELPAELGALIEQTMIDLLPTELETLDAISLLEPFPADATADVVPGADTRLLEQLEQRGLIEASAEGTVMWLRVGHPLFAESRRTAMGAIRARRLRTRILAALDAGAYPVDAVARAELSIGSEGGPDAALCLEGASVAVERLDLGLAANLAGAAVEAGGGAAAAVLQGYSLSLISRGEEAAAALAPFLEGPHPSTDAAIVAGGNRYFVLRDPAGAVADLEPVVHGSPSAKTRAETGALYAWLCAFLGRPEESLATAATVTSYADLSPRGHAFIRIARLTALSGLGRYHELTSIVEEGYTATKGGVDAAVMRAILLDGHIFALHVAGRMRESAEIVEQAVSRDRDAQPPFDAYLVDLTGRALVECGRIAEGIAELRRAAAFLEGHDDTGWAVINSLALAEACALAGEVSGADDVLARVRETWHPGHVYRLPELGRVTAVHLAATGRVAEAIAAATAAADLAERGRSLSQAIFALHAAVRYGAHGLGERLRALASEIDSPRAALAFQQADAWDRSDAARLGDLSRAFEGDGDLVAAIDAEGQAAVVWADAGRGARSAESRLRIRRLQTITGHLHTPAVTRANLGGPLSHRESEIAMLIAGGHADRDIAAMLGISTRTVEGHAHRIYEKLGVGGRIQLHLLLGDHL